MGKPKKLYLVTMEIDAYVYAESAEEAEDCADDILSDEMPDAYAREVRPGEAVAVGWESESLVYGCEGDTPLSAVWPTEEGGA